MNFSRTAPRKGELAQCLQLQINVTTDLLNSVGENFELRADLNSEYREKRKDAIKRVIANMTVGKGASTIGQSEVLTGMNRRCQRTLSRRSQKHANRGLGTEEARLPLPYELRKDST